MKTHVFRLEPGDDLKECLMDFLKSRKIDAAGILTCVGSLDRLGMRLAGAAGPTFWDQDFEIVSLVGTLSRHGTHLNICVADATGATMGGRLSDGCQIKTTAEIILAEMPGMVFKRELDQETGFRVLGVRYKQGG